MNKEQLKDRVVNVTTFSDAFDLAENVYDAWKKNKTTSFEFIKNPQGWTVKVMEVRKVEDGKEFKYKKSFILKEKANTLVEAFRLAALKWLGA